MSVIDGSGNRGHDPGRLLCRQPAALQSLFKRRAVDVAADHVHRAILETTDVVDRHEVRMRECRSSPRFAEERLGRFRPIEPVGVGYLDRHRPVELVVVALPDVTERAAPEMANHSVAAEQRSSGTGR